MGPVLTEPVGQMPIFFSVFDSSFHPVQNFGVVVATSIYKTEISNVVCSETDRSGGDPEPLSAKDQREAADVIETFGMPLVCLTIIDEFYVAQSSDM